MNFSTPSRAFHLDMVSGQFATCHTSQLPCFQQTLPWPQPARIPRDGARPSIPHAAASPLRHTSTRQAGARSNSRDTEPKFNRGVRL